MPGIEIDNTPAKCSCGSGNEMVNAIDVGEGGFERILVGHIDLDGRSG
jgi:hypothetical protein